MKRHHRYGLFITGCGAVAAVCDLYLFGAVTGFSTFMAGMGIAILLGVFE